MNSFVEHLILLLVLAGFKLQECQSKPVETALVQGAAIETPQRYLLDCATTSNSDGIKAACANKWTS